MVMPFGLCNAPSTFQSYINKVLQDILDDFCTAYLDDILIFSETLEQHHLHVGKVLERLDKAGLYADIDKSEFDQKEVKYLGIIIGVDGLKMDLAKITTIQEWSTPRTVKEVLSFLGFANFYLLRAATGIGHVIVEALLTISLPKERTTTYRYKEIRSPDRLTYSVRFSWSCRADTLQLSLHS